MTTPSSAVHRRGTSLACASASPTAAARRPTIEATRKHSASFRCRAATRGVVGFSV